DACGKQFERAGGRLMGIDIAVGEIDGTSLHLLAAEQRFQSRVRLADFLAWGILHPELPELGFDGHWTYLMSALRRAASDALDSTGTKIENLIFCRFRRQEL